MWEAMVMYGQYDYIMGCQNKFEKNGVLIKEKGALGVISSHSYGILSVREFEKYGNLKLV
jgi:hypothetical protein